MILISGGLGDDNWNKKSHFKMALWDCAINKKCCTVDGRRGICTLFSSPPRGICPLKSPHPREFAIQGKKNANSRGSARGGGRAWAQVELTDALSEQRYSSIKLRKFTDVCMVGGQVCALQHIDCKILRVWGATCISSLVFNKSLSN